MNASEIENIVRSELDGYVYEPQEPGSTVGIPWPRDRVERFVAKLKDSLVRPHLQRFLLRDTIDQLQAPVEVEAEYWVVAKTGTHVEYFDPARGEFGLAELSGDSGLPATLGVRGDLVGVFCSI
jgi:hypothetical protein